MKNLTNVKKVFGKIFNVEFCREFWFQLQYRFYALWVVISCTSFNCQLVVISQVLSFSSSIKFLPEFPILIQFSWSNRNPSFTAGIYKFINTNYPCHIIHGTTPPVKLWRGWLMTFHMKQINDIICNSEIWIRGRSSSRRRNWNSQ